VDVADGLAPDGFVLLNGDIVPAELSGLDVRCVPADRLASGSKFVNLVMVGALAAVLGEPSVDAVGDAAVELLGRKVGAPEIRNAVGDGFACLS
jgi:Pyruvate/2-oxoacid:ferredoxin oxidoreductase gamma subunit